MNLCKNLIGFKEQELDLLKKMNNPNPYRFLTWFLKNSEQFKDVNKKLSEKVSLQVDAQIKECYHNTWKASWNRKYKYYEGFLWSHNVPFPIEHSWLTSYNKIIDPTMIIPMYEVKKQLKKYHGIKDYVGRGDFDDYDYEYAGIHIPTDILNKFVMKKKKTGGFLLEYFLSQGQELVVYG